MEDKLNSSASWLLEVQKHPDILKQLNELNEQTLENDINLVSEVYEADETKRIFEPLAKNTFVESFVLEREKQAINYLTQKLKSA